MVDLQVVLADLKRDEGRRTRPYADSRGFQTIGYGHNLAAAGLCEEAITAQLVYDVGLAIQSLTIRLPWWTSKPEAVQRVLLNLTYNLGIRGLLQFVHTLALIQVDNYAGAAQELLRSTYAQQVGERAQRLAELLKMAAMAPPLAVGTNLAPP